VKQPEPKSFFTIQKLPAKYAFVVMPFILSCFMTCIVSFISTLRSVGWEAGMPDLWLGSWLLSWLVAFPVLLLILPVVRKLTSLIVSSS